MARFPWRALVAFVVVTVMLFSLIQIADLGLSQAGTEELEQVNETVTVDYSAPSVVSVASDRYTQGFNDTVTVYNSSGAELTAGEDYEWNETSGELTWLNTSDTTEGNDGSITYQYQYNTEEVREAEPVLRTVVQALPLWVFIPFLLFVGGLLWWAARTVMPRGSLGGGR